MNTFNKDVSLDWGRIRHMQTHGTAVGDTSEDGADNGLVLADTGSVGKFTVPTITTPMMKVQSSVLARC